MISQIIRAHLGGILRNNELLKSPLIPALGSSRYASFSENETNKSTKIKPKRKSTTETDEEDTFNELQRLLHKLKSSSNNYNSKSKIFSFTFGTGNKRQPLQNNNENNNNNSSSNDNKNNEDDWSSLSWSKISLGIVSGYLLYKLFLSDLSNTTQPSSQYPSSSTTFPSTSSEDSSSLFGMKKVTKTSLQEFITEILPSGNVEKLVVVDKSQAFVYGKNSNGVPMATFTIGSVEAFESAVNNQVPVYYENGFNSNGAVSGVSNFILNVLGLVPTALTIYLLYSFVKASRGLGSKIGGGGVGGGGIFSVGKSKAKLYNAESEVAVRFADVAGMDEAKEEIMEFVKFLKEPSVYEALGAKIPKGAILSGPPGTGKTLLAKATAGEAGVPFLSVSGSEFIEMFVGVGSSRVRDLFEEAKKLAPCIVFIDEIDAIGKSRAKPTPYGGGGNDERESTLNQLLVEMDGFGSNSKVVVLAGTNRPDVLDSALTRPGRFDRMIAIDVPDVKGRKDIFMVHLKPLKMNIDKAKIAEKLSYLTAGFAGADIANVCNEAALIAARRGAESVEESHFEAAIERVIGGLEKKTRVLSKEERRIVAYHEAGHAVAGWFLEHTDPLLKVSIIPRGIAALGYAQFLPKDQYLFSKEQMFDRICMMLAGRVSEELNFKTITTGAKDDLKKVTKLIYSQISSYGMNAKIGHLSLEDINTGNSSNSFAKPYSEETSRMVDEEARDMVAKAYQRTTEILTHHLSDISNLAELLLKKEVIGREDLIATLGPRPFPIKHAYDELLENEIKQKTIPSSNNDEQREEL